MHPIPVKRTQRPLKSPSKPSRPDGTTEQGRSFTSERTIRPVSLCRIWTLRRSARGGSIKLSDLATNLQALGLDQDEALVYVRLIQAGPVKAGKLAPYVDVSRSKLYRILDDLSERGFVSKSIERPTVYTPLDPNKVFELVDEHLQRKRSRVENVRERCQDPLERLQAEPSPERPEHWERIEGTAAVYEKLHDLAVEAQASFWDVSNHETTVAQSVPVVDEAWRVVTNQAEDKDLDVRLLFDLGDEPSTVVPEATQGSDRIEIRGFQAERTIHYLVVDEEEALVWVRPTPLGTMKGRQDVALWTNAPGVVYPRVLLFERLWPEGDRIDFAASPGAKS